MPVNPSDDHALILRALERWKASGRSRDALARQVGVDRRTFHRWANSPQCVIALEEQRRQLQLVANPDEKGLAMLRLLEELTRQARTSVRAHESAAALWKRIRALVAETINLLAQQEL